jgi:hypothetical protein
MQTSEGGEMGLAGLLACQPCQHTHEIDGCGRQHMLQVRLGQANVTSSTGAAPTNDLRNGAFNSSSFGVLSGIFGRKLAGSCVL